MSKGSVSHIGNYVNPMRNNILRDTGGSQSFVFVFEKSSSANVPVQGRECSFISTP